MERLSSIPDLSELGGIIEAIRASYDVDHVTYYALSLGLNVRSAKDSLIGVLSEDVGTWRREGRSLGAFSYSADWIQHYAESRLMLSDPVMRQAAMQFTPVDWSQIDWSERGSRQFFNEAYDSGVGNQGYTVPIRGPNGQFAAFTINKTCNSETWAKLLMEHKGDFMLLGNFVHQQALTLFEEGALAVERPLSIREKDAISLISEGKSRGQAADFLGISENTFRVYIDSARHKLGALNIPHAIAIAAHKGIITPQ